MTLICLCLTRQVLIYQRVTSESMFFRGDMEHAGEGAEQAKISNWRGQDQPRVHWWVLVTVGAFAVVGPFGIWL